MAVLKKSSFPENLETFNVLVSDTLETSRYFTITDLPDTFTGGKNSFLIQGSEELVPDTIVKIEIKDAKGNVIYTEPGEGIPEYYEGVSKPIAVYVYPDTAYGQCTITILGELDRYDDNGVIKTIPQEWKDKYNVRWQKSVLVNPNLPNTTKIRFYRRPKVDITESILPVYNRTVIRETISGSVYGIAVQPRVNSDLRPFKGDTIYEIYATSSIFSASMEGETLSIDNLNQSYSTIIRDVVNDKKLIVTNPYFETSSNSPTSPQIVKNFVDGNFTLNYNKTVTLTSSSLNTSFAKIKLTDLEAFTGDPARLKIFSKRKADIGNFTLLEDIQLESKELLNSDLYSSSVDVSTGILSSQNIIDDFWLYSNYNRDVFYAKYFDNTSLASSVKLTDESTQNTSQLPQRIFYYSQSLDFNKDTEYELDFLPLLSSSLYTPNKLEIYLSGSAFFNSQTGTNLGKKIGELLSDGTTRRYQLQQINFKPESNGTGKLLFAIYQGNWQLSNIGLKASQESNFSPNEITLNVSLPTVTNNDEYEFKFEFYDINNNYVPVTVSKNFTFVGGSNLSNVNLSASLFSVKPNSNIFPFGYNNSYDFQEVNTYASVPIGSDRISFSVVRTGLTGDVIFTSAAFDSGGVYIPPSVYSSIPAPYPGALNNIATDEPYLSVENFTGSLSNIEVKRIDYTASLGGFEDRISIFKVIEGTPGSDGENGEQYVIKPINGTAIKNSDPSTFIELQLTKISGNSVVDVSTGTVKLVTGSANTEITTGNGIQNGSTYSVPYNAKFYASKIDGLLEVKAFDFNPAVNKVVDTISIADITDGLTTGYIESTNGLILGRNPNNTYSPTNTALTASFIGSNGTMYSASILITPSYSSPNDRLTYTAGYSSVNIVLDSVKTDTGVNMTNNVASVTKNATVKYKFTDPNTSDIIYVSETVAVAINGTDGFNPVVATYLPSQTIVRDKDGNNASVVPFTIQLTETGSLLFYTSSAAKLQRGYFTLELAGATFGTDNSVNETKSGSITPPQPASTLSTSASFSYKYIDSKGNISNYISGSHVVSVVKDGPIGPSGGGGEPTPVIIINPVTQIVTRNPANVYSTPKPYLVSVDETGSLYRYTTTNPPPGNSYFTILINSENGTLTATANATSASIQPPTPSSTQGVSSSFAVVYRNSKGTLSQAISQSHNIGVSLDGINGPGVVFTGVWQSGRDYQFDSGSSGRRDVVLWSRNGSAPYNSYYGNLRNHTSDGTTGATGNGAPNYSTGSVGSAWLELGQQSFFVAAKIGLFEESYVQNTLNVGTSNNGGISSANITLYGGNSYPYISLGQSDSAGTQGYNYNGIFLGAVNDGASGRRYKFSIVTGSSFIKWDGYGQLQISGAISASEGRIGGVTISGSTLYAGAGNYANTDTGFYLTSASSNIFSLGNKLSWNGSTLSVNGTITATAGTIGGVTIGSNKIYIGTGDYNNTNTAFYVDSTGQFSLKDKLTWNGSTLSVNGTITITNPSTANNGGPVGSFSNGDSLTAGSIGGVTIGSTKIYIGTGTWGNSNTAFYVDNTGQFSLKDKLTWNGSTLFISGAISASAGGIGGINIDNSRLYIGSGLFSSSATPFFVSSSGRFSLGDVVIYEPSNRTLNISGTIAADTINATQISNINFGDSKGVNLASGSIGGWTLANQKITSTNASMSLNANDSSIRIGSGSSGLDVTTIVIRSGNPSALTGTSKTFSSIVDISTSALSSVYSGNVAASTNGGASPVSITIAAGEEGNYSGTVTNGSLTSDNNLIVLSGFAGYVGLNLVLQIASDSGFTNVISTAGLGGAYYSGTTSSSTIAFSPVASVPISVAFTQSGTYYCRLLWSLRSYSTQGTFTINNRTSQIITAGANNLTLTQEVSFTEITDGAFQVVRSSTRFVKIQRSGTSTTMLEVGGAITATDNITAYSSDARLKKNVIPIPNALDKIDKISGVHYEWIDDTEEIGFIPSQKTDTGVLAQDVQSVLPDAVKPAPFDTNLDGTSKSGKNYLTVQYEKIVPLLIEAIKDLKKEIEELKLLK